MGNLVLTRKKSEEVIVDVPSIGKELRITILRDNNAKMRLAFEGDQDFVIYRGELRPFVRKEPNQ